MIKRFAAGLGGVTAILLGLAIIAFYAWADLMSYNLSVMLAGAQIKPNWRLVIESVIAFVIGAVLVTAGLFLVARSLCKSSQGERSTGSATAA